MTIRQTCLPVHHMPLIVEPKEVRGTCCEWPVECPPEPYIEGCDCGCARDPNLLFGPDHNKGQYSHDFIIKKPVTLSAVGMPCDAFAVVQFGIYHCGCYVYDDWFQCGNVVRMSRSTNRITITQPGRYRLKLFNANPQQVYIRKTSGAAAQGVYA